MDFDYNKTISRTFDIFTARVQEVRIRHVRETTLKQAGRGFIGKSTGDAQLLGVAMVESFKALTLELVRELDRIISTGGNDIPREPAEKMADAFRGFLYFLGKVTMKSVQDYLGNDFGMAGPALMRVEMAWNNTKVELEHEFALLVRKHRAQPAHLVVSPAVHPATNSQVHPVHFDDYSGKQFERLVFAFALRTGWVHVEWLGETGGDSGRDIWCTADDGATTVILCANFKVLPLRKVVSDLDKLAALKTKPDAVIVAAGGNVSPKMKEKIKGQAIRCGFPPCLIWSGSELEEQIRHKAESLLRRFCHGEPFPDSLPELVEFVAKD